MNLDTVVFEKSDGVARVTLTLKSRSRRLKRPSVSARAMPAHRRVSTLPDQAASATATSAAPTVAIHGTGMSRLVSACSSTPATALPPSQSVAQPAMENFIDP